MKSNNLMNNLQPLFKERNFGLGEFSMGNIRVIERYLIGMYYQKRVSFVRVNHYQHLIDYFNLYIQLVRYH